MPVSDLSSDLSDPLRPLTLTDMVAQRDHDGTRTTPTGQVRPIHMLPSSALIS